MAKKISRPKENSRPPPAAYFMVAPFTSSPKRCIASLVRPVHIHCLLNVTLLRSPCQISVLPRTPDTASTVRVLTTTQLLYNIENPHCEDSHSCFHSSLWIGSCHSHQELSTFLTKFLLPSRSLFQPPCFHTARVQTVLPSCDHYSAHVQTLLPIW